MAAGPYVFPNLAKLNLFNATNFLNANAANWKLSLITSAWTPNATTDELFSAPSPNEIGAVFGYTAGGVALTGVVLSQAAGVVKFTSNAAAWLAAGGSIPAWRYGVLYWLGTLNGKVNPMLGYFLGDSTPADVPATTNGNTLTVTPNGAGILAAT